MMRKERILPNKVTLQQKIFCEYVSINPSLHIGWLIKHQKDGAWGEYGDDSYKPKFKGAPQATAEAIMGLLFQWRILKDKNIENSIRLALNFLLGKNQDKENGGWEDLSGGASLVDATGSVILAIESCVKSNLIKSKEVNDRVTRGINFILQQQNKKDGGWGIVKGAESKVQYTYWASLSLNSFLKSNYSNKLRKRIIDSSKEGISWIKRNLEVYGGRSCGITMGSSPNAVATAMAIEVLEKYSQNYDRSKILTFLKDSQIGKGKWDVEVDPTIFNNIPRRVYVFADLARIINCFVYLKLFLNVELFTSALANITLYEDEKGGFAFKKGDRPVVWFTSQVLMMLANTYQHIRQNLSTYASFATVQVSKKTFKKLVLIPGRWQPPHLGHYLGLRGIILSDEGTFVMPEESIKKLLEWDKIYLGIARCELDERAPWTMGQVRDIWNHILDNDDILRRFRNKIEIVTVPAEKNRVNIANAIDEITSDRKKVIVISGNNRILEQCKANEINYIKFKRISEDISGQIIRNLVSKLSFIDQAKDKTIYNELENKIHPAAFKFMCQNEFFKVPHNIIVAK